MDDHQFFLAKSQKWKKGKKEKKEKKPGPAIQKKVVELFSRLVVKISN